MAQDVNITTLKYREVEKKDSEKTVDQSKIKHQLGTLQTLQVYI